MSNRQTTFLLKKSGVAGKIPTQLQLGEIAINFADAKLYTSGTTTNSILPIGWDRVSRTGDTMTGTLYAPSISATTIQTSGTYLNNNGITTTTVSATTYYNLPISGETKYWSAGTGTNSVVQSGSNSLAGGIGALAGGSGNSANSQYSVALGLNSSADGVENLTIKTNKITLSGVSIVTNPNYASNSVLFENIDVVNEWDDYFYGAYNADTLCNIINSTGGTYSIISGNIGGIVYDSFDTYGPIIVISGCSIQYEANNYGIYGVFFAGDVATEWAEYLYTHASTFELSDGIGNTLSVDSSFFDVGIYYDDTYTFGTYLLSSSLTDTPAYNLITGNSQTFTGTITGTFILDSTIPDFSYTGISASTYYDVITPFERPAFVMGSNSIVTGSNSIVLGANITGTSSNTTYVDRLNIKTPITGVTSFNGIGISISGDIINYTLPISVVTNSNLFSTGLSNTGINASGVMNSNFFGPSAGSGATNANNSNFFGNQAGNQATGASSSNFFGGNAGYQATNAYGSNFMGFNAGYQATDALSSNFFGTSAGQSATNANRSNFMGQGAGLGATNASQSNFFGPSAGFGATSANNSNFFGTSSGNGATGANGANFFGPSAGFGATSANNSNFFGTSSGNGARGASNSNFFGASAGFGATDARNSNFFGPSAGIGATGASQSNFFGISAGHGATNASSSNFFGNNVGRNATNASGSNFFGGGAGNGATGASGSNFFGISAGNSAINASSSNFFGSNAGNGATNASSSNFFGNNVGRNATNASSSNFFGGGAGNGATGASYSNLFGYNVGNGSVLGSLGSNNIIIGTNISLPSGATNSINLGGVLFGSNAYSITTGNPSIVAQSTGRIGINVVNPSQALHVSGNTLISGNLTGTTISATTYLNLPSYELPITIVNTSNLFSTGLAGTGINASGVTNSNFFGLGAGRDATNASNSNFFGPSAGRNATNANGANFFGNLAGSGATGANNSNFFGREAGNLATGASYSNLFGYNVGNGSVLGSLGSNNIIIGTNISLPEGATNRINLGGVLFGTGTYSTTTGNPSIVAQSTGRIGVNVVSPATNLHVVGNSLITGRLSATTISATTINKIDSVVFNTGTTSAATVPGTVYFDNTEKALSYNTSINQGVTVNLGQQQYLRVFNNSGTSIAKGKALEILSAYSGLPSVTLALNKQSGFNVVGVSAEIIPNNSEGIIITNGIISNIEVTGSTVGDLLYASDSIAGNLDSATKYLSFPLTARTNSVGYVIQTGTTTGKVFINIQNENNVLSFTDLQREILEANAISTGIFSFSGFSLSTGNTFNIGPIQGWIVDNTTNFLKPEATYVNYSGQTGLTTPFLSSATETYILLTSAATITLLNTFPTPKERRQNIYIGKIGHGNRTSLINAFNEPDFDISPLSQLRDVMTPIKLINSGVLASPNGVNLSFNTSAGVLWGLGIGFITDTLNPNSISVSGNSPTTFQYRTKTGGTATNTTTIIPGNYDLNGVVTPIGTPTKQATNQRIYLLQNGIFRIQYGQTVYIDLVTAVAAAQNETFTTFPNFTDNGILVGILSLRSDTTNLSNSEYAKFLSVSKFGEVMGGTGGLSTTTLQQAYNNSTQPEIVTNSTLGALSIQNGTGNADNVTRLLEVENIAGTITSFIRADGYISGTTIQTNGVYLDNNGVTATTFVKSGGTSLEFLKSDGSVDSTIYQPLLNNPIIGTGTTNYIPKFTGSSLTNSQIFDNGTNIGFFTNTTSQNLDASTNNFLLGSDNILNTRTDGVDKIFRFMKPHTTNSEEPVMMFMGTGNSVIIGGGSSLANAANSLSFFTALNTTTLIGTERARFTNNGNLLLGTTVDNVTDKLQVSGSSRTIGLTVQGTTSTDGGQLNTELLTTGTGTNWTGTSFAAGYTHVTGSTVALTSTLAAIINNYYQITYTVTGRTAGSFTINFGGYSYGSITSTGALGPQVTTTDTLVITPTSDFNGTIVLSIKVITTGTASLTLLNSSGGISSQMRALTDTNSLSIGTNAGLRVTSGLSNLFLGNSAGASTTSGFENVYMGSNAGSKNTVGLYNVAIGNLALTNNRTGIRNLAIGRTALYSSVGGSTNIGIGTATLYDMIIGDGNTAIGSSAGAVLSTNAVLTGLSNSILIGNNTKPLANNDTNEIIISSNGIGLGSNTTVIGNSSTTATAIYGDLLLGTTVDNGTDKLQVNGISRTIGLKVQGTTLTDGGQLGVELLTTGTGTNWTGTSFATGYTHTTGSTATLTSTLAAAINNYYQIAYTVTGRTAGSFSISFGGYSITTLTATGVVGPMATTTGTLVVTPTTDFDGTIVLSIKAITNGTPSVLLLNSDGNTSGEINISKITSNTFFGREAGRRNTTGTVNVGIGYQALLNNTTGGQNTAIGYTSLANNSTGQSNTATGFNSLSNSTTGNFNTATGHQALQNNTNGSANIGIGYQALMNNISGAHNIAIGFLAGRYISGGIVTNTNTTTSIYIGGSTKPLADNQTNQIVIGYNSDGLGSNTTVIGNSSTTATAIYGDLLLGTTVDNGTDKLQVSGSINVSQYKISALNTAPATSTSTGTLGEIRITATHIYVCTATNTWVRTALTSW